MSLQACLDEQIGRLVHPTAHASSHAVARHRLFIDTRLAVGLGALAFVPIFMASGGVPRWVDALVLAWLLLPLLAVARVSANGNLKSAELISYCAWAGLAATAVLGGLASPATGAMLFLLLPLEASLGGTLRTTGIAAGVALAGSIALMLAAKWVGAGTHPAETLFLVLAASYAAMLCVCGARVQAAELDAERERSRRSAVLGEIAPDLMVRFDGAGATPLNGRAAQVQFGLDAKELEGRGFFERVHVADRPAFLQLISDGGRGDRELSGALRLRLWSQPGREGGFEEPVFTTVDLRVRRWPDAAEPHAVLATIRASVDRAQSAEPVGKTADPDTDGRWRDRFLATVSHELRTPLNAIIGFSEILATDSHAPKETAKRREYAEIIHASGQHLLDVVNSMLDLSKIDAGKFDLTIEPFRLAELLMSCGDMMRLKAEKARIDLQWSAAPLDLTVAADKRALRQIVLNLLSNALKFTPEYGQVSLEARLDGDMLVLLVVDTGIGILAPDMARLGDPFFQAQNSYDRRFEGTGLGLSVVTGLVGLHGGTITAESAPGEGTRIAVRLPANGRQAGWVSFRV